MSPKGDQGIKSKDGKNQLDAKSVLKVLMLKTIFETLKHVYDNV